MSREDELISVVVPVYHVETYIERCVESFIAADIFQSGNYSRR